MAEFQLIDRQFSRLWRRSKLYSRNEIKWLARKRGFTVRESKQRIQVLDQKQNKVVATFGEIPEDEDVVKSNPRLEAFAALRVGLFLLVACLTSSVYAHTYQEQVVAAVLAAEARGEGTRGMTAVAEVISRRAQDKKQTPLQVVRRRAGNVYAFSCFNGSSEEAVLAEYRTDPVYPQALDIAHTACISPANLPGITHSATHYANKKLRPWWVKKKQKPVAVIGNHAFWRVKRY